MYKKVGWKDYPNTTTPINTANLDKMDAGILANATLLGETDISDIGDGKVTGAINTLNNNLQSKQDKISNAKTVISSFPFTTAVAPNGTSNCYKIENAFEVIVELNIKLNSASTSPAEITSNLGTTTRIDSIVTDSNGTVNQLYSDSTGRLYVVPKNEGNLYFTGSIVIPKL